MVPLVIAVLNYNGYALSRACVESLRRLTGPPHRIVVVDNASREPEAERLAAEFPDEVEALTLPRNLGVAGGYNAGIKWARQRGATYVLLLNNDTIVEDPHMAERLIEAFGPDVFAVGPVVRDPTGRVWSSGGWLDWKTYMTGHTQAERLESADGPYTVDWIDGSSMLLSVDAACRLGGFEDDFFLYWEETDICIRAREAGCRCLVQPVTSITHMVNQTAKPSQIDRYMLRNSILFIRRHGTWRQNLDFLIRLTCWRMPLFAARRIKHRGGIWQTTEMTAGAYLWNLRDAIRHRGWKRRHRTRLEPADAPPFRAAGPSSD